MLLSQLTVIAADNNKVTENEESKVFWDLRIQIDKHLPHNIPDLAIVHKT